MAEEIGVRATIDTTDLDKGLSKYESALGDMYKVTDKAIYSTRQFDNALESLIESEKELAAGKEAEKYFESMTAAEKDAFLTTKKMNDALEEQKKKVKGVAFGVKELESAWNMAEKAIRIIQQVSEQTVGVYIDLAAQVRDLSRATGISSEEASKLIETMGDLKIPTDSLKMAMRTMIQNGMNPTIDTLAKMSDEYLALKDPVLQAQYAIDKFGARGGLEMTKALEMGGDELRRMNASIGQNQVLTEASTRAARQFEIAMDGVNDVVEGLKIQIGQFLVGALNDLGTTLSYLSGGAAQKVTENWKKNNVVFAQGTKSFEEYTAAAKKWQTDVIAAGGTDDFGNLIGEKDLPILDEATYLLIKLTKAHKDYRLVLIDAAKPTATFADKVAAVNYALQEQKQLYAGFVTGLRGGVPVIRASASALEAERNALDQSTAAADRLTMTTLKYNTLAGGQWSAEQKSYADKMQESQDKVDGLRKKIEELSTKKHLTDAEKQSLADYWAQINDLTGEMEELKAAHKRATDQIVLGWIMAALAADGVLDQKDIDILLGLQTQWGLITQEEKDAYEAAVTFALKQRELADHPTVIKIVYDYSTVGNPNPPYSPQGGYIPQAEGGQGVVTEPTMFLLGEKGEPEYYEHTPLSHMGDAQMQDIAAAPAGAAAGGGVTLEFSGDIAINNGMDWAEFANGVQQVLRQEISK